MSVLMGVLENQGVGQEQEEVGLGGDGGRERGSARERFLLHRLRKHILVLSKRESGPHVGV